MIYTYYQFQRSYQYNTVLRNGRIFQQYVVDRYCEVEAERPKFLRRNKIAPRAAVFRSLIGQLDDLRATKDKTDALELTECSFYF